MSDTSAQPVPVLSYANLSGLQPPTSRFILEDGRDGIRLTEIPHPSTGKLHQWIGSLLLLSGLAVSAGLVWVAAHDSMFRANRATPAVVLVALIFSAGTSVFLQGRILARLPTVLDVRDGHLTVHLPRLLFRKRRWRLRAGLNVTSRFGRPGWSLSRAHVCWLSDVVVNPSFRRQILIVADHPKDECIWIARQLSLAIEQALTES